MFESDSDDSENNSFLMLKLINKLRSNIIYLDKSPNSIKRSYSTSSYMLTNTLSLIISSSILCPLYRIKLLYQTNYLESKKKSVVNIIKGKTNY